jgi:hypothetical protein
VAVLAGWHAWGRGGDHAIAYRDVTAQLGAWEFTHTTGRTYRNRQKLVDYLERAWPGHRPRLPAIDFGREEAVLVSYGPRSGSGYELSVVRATERRGSILVLLRERTPTLANPGTAGVTYPYRLLVLPRAGKHVSVHLEGRP